MPQQVVSAARKRKLPQLAEQHETEEPAQWLPRQVTAPNLSAAASRSSPACMDERTDIDRSCCGLQRVSNESDDDLAVRNQPMPDAAGRNVSPLLAFAARLTCAA